MTRLKPCPRTSATATTLSSVTEERIHRLVFRAAHCSFGAEPALRNAVALGASEMLDAGASFPAVRQAITQCVLSHPSVLPDKRSLMTGDSYVSAILKRMLAWTDNVVLTPPMHTTR